MHSLGTQSRCGEGGESALQDLTLSPLPSQALNHRLAAHPPLDLDVVGSFPDGHGKANLLLGAACVLRRNTPRGQTLLSHKGVCGWEWGGGGGKCLFSDQTDCQTGCGTPRNEAGPEQGGGFSCTYAVAATACLRRGREVAGVEAGRCCPLSGGAERAHQRGGALLRRARLGLSGPALGRLRWMKKTNGVVYSILFINIFRPLIQSSPCTIAQCGAGFVAQTIRLGRSSVDRFPRPFHQKRMSFSNRRRSPPNRRGSPLTFVGYPPSTAGWPSNRAPEY